MKHPPVTRSLSFWKEKKNFVLSVSQFLYCLSSNTCNIYLHVPWCATPYSSSVFFGASSSYQTLDLSELFREYYDGAMIRVYQPNYK